jgi:hypothetical protein
MNRSWYAHWLTRAGSRTVETAGSRKQKQQDMHAKTTKLATTALAACLGDFFEKMNHQKTTAAIPKTAPHGPSAAVAEATSAIA